MNTMEKSPAITMEFYLTLRTVKKTAEFYSTAITEPALRWLIFNEKQNGFSVCLRRLGRKILIDLDAFEQWIDRQGGVN